MRTVAGLVDEVCVAAQNLGLDISPSDTAFIVAGFLEGLVGDDPAFEAAFRPIIDAVESVRDES